MKTYTDLNTNEIEVLKAISISSKGNGGDFTDFKDVMTEISGLTQGQVKGYISQLSQKKYISVETGTSNPLICTGAYVDFLTEYEF